MKRNVLFVLLFFVLVLAACSNGATSEKVPGEDTSPDAGTTEKNPDEGTSSELVTTETITDEDTSSDIQVIENVEPDMTTYDYTADNMDRGTHDYYDKPLVIDPNVTSAEMTRGDVVFFEDKENGKEVARVVALPGEKIAIKKGQIYIDDKILDTFYGKAHRGGLDKETYLEKMKESQGKDFDEKGATEAFELTKEEIELADDEYYVVSDDWLRGNQTVLKEDELIGKVVGYSE